MIYSVVKVNVWPWHQGFRKLEKVLRDLKPLEERGKLAGFLNNVKGAEALTGLAEDIRDAILGYQVCARTASAYIVSLHCSKTCPKTALQQDIYLKNHRFIVSLIP